jgi:hypothetical protein
VLLLWIYYTAQIFLLGSGFTRAFARRHGSHAGSDAPEEDQPAAANSLSRAARIGQTLPSVGWRRSGRRCAPAPPSQRFRSSHT